MEGVNTGMYIAFLLFLVFVIVAEFAAAIFKGPAGENEGPVGWKALRLNRKICYLIAVGLPLLGLVLFCALPKGWSNTRSTWYLPILAAPGLLLGLGNLALVFARRRRKRLKLWHGLLTASLLPSLTFVGWTTFVWVILSVFADWDW